MTDPSPFVVLGTHNAKKRAELGELLEPHAVGVRTLADFPAAIEVVEDRDTFAGNAQKKASEQAAHLGAWVLADDSGIEIDALGGAPGVFSARFASRETEVTGKDWGTGDEANNRLVLAKLEGIPVAKRGGRYVCHVALANPEGRVVAEAVDYCRGVLLDQPRGSGGFGYDPLFEIREYHRTFAEMGPAVKRALSHRSRAMRTILPALLRLVQAE